MKNEVFMENKRYKLGVIDLYSVAKNETEIESTPAFFVTLCDAVDRSRLSDALREALSCYPLFATTLEYKGGYTLVSHNGELPIIDSAIDERPEYFGKESGGYLFRFCVYEREIAFEWSRILTDEYCARDFLIAVLSAYFGEPIKAPDGEAENILLEAFAEKSAASTATGASAGEKPKENKKKDYSGVKNSHAPTRNNPDAANLHTLRVGISELRAASGRGDASLESVIIPIFSNVLHRRVGDGDGISVTADVTFDCRSADLNSMHNFSVSKILAYSGILGRTDVKRVMELYEKMLSSARDSLKDEAEQTIRAVKPLVSIRPRILADIASLIVSKAVKGERSDFAFISLGEIKLPGKVKQAVADIKICAIPYSADAGISVLTLSDEVVITITENYIDEKIISDFVSISKMLGINFKLEKSKEFTQSRLKLK